MAAKLKKRALAEYQSQVVDPEDEKKSQKSSKKLKLLLPPRRTDSTSSSVTSSRRLSSCTGDSVSALETLIHQIVLLSPTISNGSLSLEDVQDITKKVTNALVTKNLEQDGDHRPQLFLLLSNIVKSYPESRLNIDFSDEWLNDVSDDDSKTAFYAFLSSWFSSDRSISDPDQAQLLKSIQKDLKTSQDHQVKISALEVLGNSTHVLSAQDRSLASLIMAIINRHTKSQDPRIRQAAFEALLNIHNNGHKLDSSTYQDLCQALTDDYEGVRLVVLQLIHVMAVSYPEEQVRDHDNPNNSRRLIDDSFGKICFAVQDLSVQVREMSVQLIGTLETVGQEFLEQTLDKKLMSNMRTKKSAHERQAQIVASGEWSSGKKWADDAPR